MHLFSITEFKMYFTKVISQASLKVNHHVTVLRCQERSSLTAPRFSRKTQAVNVNLKLYQVARILSCK